MIVHRHRLIATCHSLIHLVPLRLRSDHCSPLRNAPLHSDVPLCNHGLHARDADECTGHRSVNSIRPLVTVAECATRHPAPYTPISRTTRLLQSHSDGTRYIAGIILLTVFFSAQAHRRHRCASSSQSTVRHFLWNLTQEPQSRLLARTPTTTHGWQVKGRHYSLPMLASTRLHVN